MISNHPGKIVVFAGCAGIAAAMLVACSGSSNSGSSSSGSGVAGTRAPSSQAPTASPAPRSSKATAASVTATGNSATTIPSCAAIRAIVASVVKGPVKPKSHHVYEGGRASVCFFTWGDSYPIVAVKVHVSRAEFKEERDDFRYMGQTTTDLPGFGDVAYTVTSNFAVHAQVEVLKGTTRMYVKGAGNMDNAKAIAAKILPLL